MHNLYSPILNEKPHSPILLDQSPFQPDTQPISFATRSHNKASMTSHTQSYTSF